MADSTPVAAIFVDLDNTIVDTDSALKDAVIAALVHVGARMSDGLAPRLVDMWWTDPGGWYERYEAGEISVPEQRRRRFLDVAAEAGVPANVYDEWERAYVDKAVFSARLFDDTLPFLDAVARWPVVVVTNVESPHQRRKIAQVGLSERLRDVVGADLASRPKPDPALFEIACTRVGVTPDRAVHIGDSWAADVVGAQRAGIRAVWLDREDAGRSEPIPSDVWRVTSLSQIPALLG